MVTKTYGMGIRVLLLLAATTLVSLAQPSSPNSLDSAAQVIQVSGQVSVLKDLQPWALTVGASIAPKQIIISGPDGSATLRVADGSTFDVFPNSRVVFRNNPPNFRDLLDVLVGRVKIHIQKWGGQPNPNQIHTPTAVIAVRGTTFDVSVADEDDSTEVSVEEGQVAVRHAIKGGESKILNPGESLRVYKDQPLAMRRMDKGVIAERVFRGVTDALYTVLTNSRGVGSGTTGPKFPGETSAPPPPTTAPPPPPSAPPPPAP